MAPQTHQTRSLSVAWNALTDTPPVASSPPATRLEAYHAACAKYSDEIRAIQRYFPGWKPPFEADAESL